MRAVVGEERGLPRPARPHLVRALGQLGGFRESTADGDGNGNDVAIANENLRGATPPSSSARSRRLERERTETRALVSAAVRGAATCLVTLSRPANSSTPTDATYSADAIDLAPASSVRTWAYSDRRRVAHALLDAIGPAARRNGCVGLAHVASVRAVFAGCLLKKAAPTDSPAASFDVGSACPRVAVRFANILRVPPTAAIDPGAASALAEALVRAVANGREDGDDGVVEDGDEDGDDSVVAVFDDSEPDSECILVRRSSPLSRLVSRAGAVAELLSWSGESAAFPESSAEILAVACVEAGHASAAEALARDVPSLSRRLVEAHAELGNHRAARRVAAELEWDRTDDRSELLFDLESLRVADTFDPDAFANDAESTARVSARADGHTPTPLANILADANEGILVVNCASTLETARERARFATNDALFASRTCPSSSVPSSSVPISSSSFVSFVGLDCEWRPGVAGAPVELVQLAFGANRAGSGRARAVILDCPALLGDAADASLAEATARFLAEVFSRAVIVGFGVAGDVERLFASYPERFRVPAVPVPGPTERSEPSGAIRPSGARDPSPFPDATCACAKDAAVSLGIPAAATASLSSLCRAVLDGRALDKTQQKSDWARRPLTREQIAYAAADALAPAMAFHALAKVAKKNQKEDGRGGKRTRDEGASNEGASDEGASEEGASDEGASSETTNARIEDGNDVSIGRENDDVKNERRKEDVETVASVVAFARAWTRRVNASRAIERSERSAPPPRTVDDVLAEIARVPGLALETWPRAEDARAEDVETRRDGDERRATLCKTLGVVVTGAGSNPGAPRFVVCALRAGDDARLDMDALADAVARRRDERLDERLDERRDERLDEDDDERLDRRVSSASRSVRKVRCRMATRDELAREFGFPPGSMGPFGLRPDPNARRATFVDEDVFEGDAKKKVAVGGGASDVKVVGDAETLFRACGAVIARVSRRA